MSGDGKRGGASASVLAPILDSTNYTATIQFERVLSDMPTFEEVARDASLRVRKHYGV
jgi:hypothetical protein